MSAEARMNRAARQVLGPWTRDIGEWQREVARLVGQAERLGRKGHDEELSQRINAMQETILAERAKIHSAVENSRRDLHGHGRVTDVRRALESMLAGLTRARTNMLLH
jgi:hypothetical protein